MIKQEGRMGKFQSKLASRRRQRPEGGSLASNALTYQRESELIHIHKTKLTKNLYVELRENKSDCNPKVVEPSEKKTPDGGSSLHFQVHNQTRKRSGHAGVTECNNVLDMETQQEWVFTLYNFDNSGKVTKEDICSLIHSMYEVLGASVRRPYGGTAPLEIKLMVTPSADPKKTSQMAAEKEQSASQEAGTPARRRYCVDENIERRNHYLDLAGIENYTSKFDKLEPPTQESGQKAPSALQHHPVVIREHCTSPDFPRGPSSPLCHKSKTTPVCKDRKPCRLHGHHPAPWCHPSQSPQRTHSKRLRSRAQDAAPHLRPLAGPDREPPTCRAAATASPAKRHEHNHHHEHHHHHHHHYHPS